MSLQTSQFCKVPEEWNLDQANPKSRQELCMGCKSARREFMGTEANFGLDDEAIWQCIDCEKVYGTDVPPYKDSLAAQIGELDSL